MIMMQKKNHNNYPRGKNLLISFHIFKKNFFIISLVTIALVLK